MTIFECRASDANLLESRLVLLNKKRKKKKKERRQLDYNKHTTSARVSKIAAKSVERQRRKIHFHIILCRITRSWFLQRDTLHVFAL
jgi:rRNA pseudouridine-1189 N-methylase Emg1 (Nep1/Mra1 family)